jgi:Fe-Mn family superoxide dismutase
MRLHHDKHHKNYVVGLNKAETMMEKARKSGDFELITHWEREAAFNGAGHYLHTIFWDNMKPKDGDSEPKEDLLHQIIKDFGSFSAFKKHFSAAAEKAEAVGWAILIWAPRSNRLEILQAEKHQNLSQWDVIPLLVLDVWEHAYYLKYNNERKAYIEAWWNVVNWPNVNERFDKARTITWKPY